MLYLLCHWCSNHCGEGLLYTGVILVKGSIDTISNTSAGHCKVQPRQPWDMILLLGSFMSGTHGRVEAWARDAASFLASRRRSISGGLCGEPGKTLACTQMFVSAHVHHPHWVVSLHSLCSRSYTLYTLHSHLSSNKKALGPASAALLQMWAQKDWSLESPVGHWTANVAVGSSYRPLLFLVWWLKKTCIFEWTRETLGGPLSWYCPGIPNRAEDFNKLTMQLLSWQKGGSKVVT